MDHAGRATFNLREDTSPKQLVAYRASNITRVEVNDLPLVGQVIDAGMSAGANRVEGVASQLQDELKIPNTRLAAGR